jgi:cytochrome c
MFDTMTTTKVIGAFCGALLVFMLGHWASTLVYSTAPAQHGDEEAHAAYIIEVEDAGESDKAADEGPTFEEMFASADIKKGAKVASKCKACHKFEDGVNATGPSLYGVVGREVDTEPGYNYTGALEKVADVWTPENLNHFLTNPKKFAPGTAMGFAGLKKMEDRANLIAYLKSIPEG